MGKVVSFSSFAYPRETLFDDEVPTVVRPKKQFLTPAQKHEMEKAIKAAKGKKAKEAVRRDYEPSRVSRRLLFVRRSYNERNKEQVFA